MKKEDKPLYYFLRNLANVLLRILYRPKKINKEIKERFGFTVNIGIANNKLCAKMASDFEKPDKIHTLYDYEVDTKMKNLPIDELFGIGKKTSEKLKQMGIKTINDLANYNLVSLKKVFKAKLTIKKSEKL